MARLKNGILGGFSGAIGDVVGYIRYGKAYVKKKSKKSEVKPSPAQLVHRQNMKVVNSFINTTTEFVRIGFALEAKFKSHSANASAKSYQLKNALTGEYPEISIDYSRALLSKGQMHPPLNASALPMPGGIHFSWEVSRQTEVYQSRSRAMILVHCPELGKSFLNLNAARITERSDFLPLPVEFIGQVLHAYISFRTDNQKKISNSTYIGPIYF